MRTCAVPSRLHKDQKCNNDRNMYSSVRDKRLLTCATSFVIRRQSAGMKGAMAVRGSNPPFSRACRSALRTVRSYQRHRHRKEDKYGDTQGVRSRERGSRSYDTRDHPGGTELYLVCAVKICRGIVRSSLGRLDRCSQIKDPALPASAGLRSSHVR